MDATPHPSAEERRIAFHGFGCKLNQYEIQAMREGFLRHGCREVSPAESPDVFVVNTCTVTESADRSALALIRSFHRRNPSAQIVVTGCYATADAREVQRLPGVTHVVDNRSKNQVLFRVLGLPEITEQDSPFFEEGISYFEDHARAFVKVQDGCNYFCSFCKIPYVRGRLVSREPSRILEEVRRLAGQGYEEIVLSGVCLGSYGRDSGGPSLAGLIEDILRISGSFRVRLSSIDPRDTSMELADLMRRDPRLCPHLHLSLQSGDDRILERMRRGYTAAQVESLVTAFRGRVPRLGLSTDVIVGFPGEDEEAYGRTRRLLERLRFHRVHVFPYSERAGTKAAGLDGAVPADVIGRREHELKRALRGWTSEIAVDEIGRTIEVLVEYKRAPDGRLQGFSDHYLRCAFEGEDSLKGRLVRLTVNGWDGERLSGIRTETNGPRIR